MACIGPWRSLNSQYKYSCSCLIFLFSLVTQDAKEIPLISLFSGVTPAISQTVGKKSQKAEMMVTF